MDAISTGFPALDLLIGIGGFPCGRISEVAAEEAWLLSLLLPVSEGSALLDICDRPIVAVWTQSIDASLMPLTLSRIEPSARRNNTAVVFLTRLDHTVPKALKFYASLRIRVDGGQARLIKNMMAATQGHSCSL